jgi:hypothetical protein
MLTAAVLIAGAGAALADVESGPAAGSAVEPLTVFAVTGDVQNQETDYVKQRDGKPTVWFFVPADKWSRPTAGLLRDIDQKLGGVADDGKVVAVWLTDDVPKAKQYMPIADGALKPQRTAFTVYEQDADGPAEWGVNTDADVTVVVTRGGKVLKSFGFVSANSTVADDVLAVLKPNQK